MENMKIGIEASAPAVVKLFGEHAVVFGRPAVAAAVSLRAYAAAEDAEDANSLKIVLPDMGMTAAVPKHTLEAIYTAWSSRDKRTNMGILEFIQDLLDALHVDLALLPYITVGARLQMEHGGVTGVNVTVHSDIPISSGYASSAACVTAFTEVLVKRFGIKLTDDEFIDTARDGDRIIHKKEGAGRIDVAASYMGGVGYIAKDGFHLIPIGAGIPIITANTGSKLGTDISTSHVAELHEKDRDNIERTFDAIEKCSSAGIEAIVEGNLGRLGALMLRNQRLLADGIPEEGLRGLGVSSPGLDRFVKDFVDMGGMGAKLSGGGMGGMGFGITDNPQALYLKLKENGYDVQMADITTEGAKSSLKQEGRRRMR